VSPLPLRSFLPLLLPAALLAQDAAGDSAAAPPGRVANHWHLSLDAHRALRGPQPTEEDVLRAVGAELGLGRPERARSLLGRHRLTDAALEPELAQLDAALALASGRFAEAARGFAAGARRAAGVSRGILAAQAGDAFERAGLRPAAAEHYRLAGEELPELRSWLALREARSLEDTAAAFRLLEEIPPPARRFVPEVRAGLLAAAGDTARAVAILAAASHDGRAARLALAARDSAGARQLAYRALRAGDSAIANVGVELARTAFPPRDPAELLALSRAVRRTAPRDAAALAGQAVAAGTPSAATLAYWGDVLSDLRKYDSALTAYTRAAALRGPEAPAAEFNRARTLIRLGRPIAAAEALARFTTGYPDHPSTPMALFLRADLAQESTRRALADTVFGVLIQRWPTHEYATQARLRLAGAALVQGDTGTAERWYRAEVEARGGQQLAARFFLASLVDARGDSVGAREQWLELARRDSIGYYGGLARGRVQAPPPRFARDDAPMPRHLGAELRILDLLDQVGFAGEAQALVAWLVARDDGAEYSLSLARALVDRGRTTHAINLGWRAARTLTLNDARVLRAIYPWPLRDVVHAEAEEFGLDPYLLAALIRQESSFDPAARSRAGARGLMQVMPATARQAARRQGLDWSDQLLRVPDANIHIGASHLATLLRHYRGELVPSLAAYNAGLTPVERWRRRFPEARTPALFVERIPYVETRGYVRAVLRNLEIYRVLYPAD
jgi:soluble lytic murein transglycosylase